MEAENDLPRVSKETLWYLDNYILLREYYDHTISRIAARCVRMGNIAMEEHPYNSYILDVLEEISNTGDYILQHKELYPYVEKKIQGGLEALKKNLKEYKTELKNNASPDMIKEDALEVERMKKALGGVDKAHDPTIGAGMSMEELMSKLTKKDEAPVTENAAENVEASDNKKIIKVRKASNEVMPQEVPEKVEVEVNADLNKTVDSDSGNDLEENKE